MYTPVKPKPQSKYSEHITPQSVLINKNLLEK